MPANYGNIAEARALVLGHRKSLISKEQDTPAKKKLSLPLKSEGKVESRVLKESHNIPARRSTCDIIQRFGDYNHSRKETIVDDSTTYTVGEILGKGGFAKVYRLHPVDENSVMAVKIISKRSLVRPEKRDKVAREIDIQKRMKHKNVVEFIKNFEAPGFIFIVLEYCGTRTLSNILKNRKTITEPEVRYYLQQIVSGCRHIHSKGVVHRDLKLSNLFINDDMVLKIGDFGLSAFLQDSNEKKESICGTPNYISPEVIRKTGHSFPADVWAVGCIVYALLSGRPPFETHSLKETYKLISVSKYNQPLVASTNARDLVQRCLQIEPLQRPSMSEIETLPFLSEGFIPAVLPQSAMLATPLLSETPCNKDFCDKNGNKVICMVEYMIETIDTQVISAYGGKKLPELAFAPLIECELLLNTVHMTFENIQDKYCKGNPVQSKNVKDCIWITKWVDYSHKHGFGFQLSNGVNGACFKDGFSIAVSGDECHVGLHDPAEEVTLECVVEELPEGYQRTLQVINYFVKYMDETLIKGGEVVNGEGKEKGDSTKCMKRESISTERNGLSDVYILHWMRTKECIVMCLSTGTVQVNFFGDHTKLIVSRVADGEYKLMFVNTKRQISVYDLTEVARHGVVEDVKMRLRFLMLQLNLIMQKYS